MEDSSPPARVPTANAPAVGTLPAAPAVPEAFVDLVWAWLREPDPATAWEMLLDLTAGTPTGPSDNAR